MLAPVSRICQCPTPHAVPGEVNHTPECNAAYVSHFWTTVASARRAYASPAPVVALPLSMN